MSVIQLKVNIITSEGQVGPHSPGQMVSRRMSSQSVAGGGGLGKDELDD